MKFLAKIVLIFFLITSKIYASDVTSWLKFEIDQILNAYKNDNISNVEKFQYIENTINMSHHRINIEYFVQFHAFTKHRTPTTTLTSERLRIFGIW